MVEPRQFNVAPPLPGEATLFRLGVQHFFECADRQCQLAACVYYHVGFFVAARAGFAGFFAAVQVQCCFRMHGKECLRVDQA
jgi:hypothetical protein